ncbi:MAG: hypothetical protein R2862_02215 [Thermoanaerobaculia bacterium]
MDPSPALLDAPSASHVRRGALLPSRFRLVAGLWIFSLVVASLTRAGRSCSPPAAKIPDRPPP